MRHWKTKYVILSLGLTWVIGISCGLYFSLPAVVVIWLSAIFSCRDVVELIDRYDNNKL